MTKGETCADETVKADPNRLTIVFQGLPFLFRLTNRQRQICVDTMLGYSPLAMGQRLGITEESAKISRKRLYRRLGISSSDDLLRLAIAELAEIPPEAP